MAAVLCDRWVPTPLLDRLSEMCESGARDVIVTAAGLHDLGKATPVFQGQLLGKSESAFRSHVADLNGAGYRCTAPGLSARMTDDEKWLVRRHEIASAVLLHGDMWEAGSVGLGAVVAGHHGQWRIPGDDELSVGRYYRWLLTDPAWAGYREWLIALLADVAGIDPLLSVHDGAATPLLTGLVCLADWLASDLADRHDSPDLDEIDWAAYWEQRLVDAGLQIERLLGVPWRPSSRRFTDVFRFEPTLPAQQCLVREGEPPGLRIVTVQTGDGKTEAALGRWLLSAAEAQGLFFALPTMATADAMLPRVRAMLMGAPGGVYGALAHSRAILNEFYDLPDDLRGEIHSEDGLRPGHWFRGRGRALLAPVTVGTVDQLLLGVLRSRFNFMRLLGAACKMVVLDEVHSYDPYMSRLVEQFLRWAGEFRIDVVMLSATLPVEQTRAYVAAYGGDRAAVTDAYPAVTSVVAGHTEVTELAASDRARMLMIDYHRAASDQTAATIIALARRLAAAHPTAKIGVIVNTVSRCQQIGATLIGDGLPVQVMHSRFTGAVRSLHVHDATARYGRASSGGLDLLVATQVAEQSVDLDFDVLVTDLCPAPSLIQRAGRVHRHDSNPRRLKRPEGLESPTVHVVVPDPLLRTPRGHLPYSAAVILATWRDGLREGAVTEIAVPGDIQDLVDRCHVTYERAVEHDRLIDEHLLTTAVQAEQARIWTVPDPEVMRLDAAGGLSDFSRGDLDEFHFQTRWADDTRADVLVVGNVREAWDGPVPEDPDVPTTRALLGCVVTATGGLARRLLDDTTESPWEKGVLAGVRVLDLNTIPGYRLDPLLGFLRAQPDGKAH